MISQTAEYALRAVICLAAQPGQPMTAQAIAAQAKVPPGYLAKVMQALVKCGLAASQRGLNGGFTLRREPRELTVYDVVQAVDPIKRILSCPLGLPEHRDKLCALHARLDRAMADIEASFRDTRIDELLREGHPLAPGFPMGIRRPTAAPGTQARPQRPAGAGPEKKGGGRRAP